jgi:hemolysin D
MLRLPSLVPQRSKDLLAAPISAFESETQAFFVRTTAHNQHAILHLLVGIIVLSVVLMSIVKVDRVVTSTGRLVPTQGTLYVQPLDRAIVRQIKVHAGDVVKAGQVLAELDPTFAQADVTQKREHLASATATVSRLEAELSGQPYVGGSSPAEQLQLSIWNQRQAEYQQKLADFDARIESSKAAVRKAEQDVAAYEQRLGYATKVQNMETSLEQRGNSSKLKVLNASDTRAETDRLLSEARNALAGGGHDIEALTAQREGAIGKWQGDAGSQLVAARDDLHETQQTLAKADKVSSMISLKAPEDAVVLEIGSASVGSVIETGTSNSKPLFTLVPINGPIEADVDIDSKDVGFIQEGDPVQIKLDAYPFIHHGTAKGSITSISEGSFTQGDDQQIRAPFFRARIRIDSTPLRDLPAKFRLIPGMTVIGDVLVGRRTILSYLVGGGLRVASEAMREP